MSYKPNPQGKGLVPVLQTIEQHQFRLIVAPKKLDQVEMELFTSMFVLQSAIKFNPVVGKPYWLYCVNGLYRLLMVAPEEWTSPYQGSFIGECELQEDRTWTLTLSAEMAMNQQFMTMLEKRRKVILSTLDAVDHLEDGLPKYNSTFSFHAKVLAYSLSRSLKVSMKLSGINQLSYEQAKGLLSQD